MNILENKSNYRLSGRVTRQEGVLYLGYSASFLEFTFKGTKVEAEFITDRLDWEEIHRARENIILPKECGTCPYVKICDVCAAVTLAETGEFGGVPEYACKKAQEYSRLCKNFIEEMNCKNSGFQEVMKK